MAVLVYNKNTGKYLKKHSGSANNLKQSLLYRNKDYTKELVDKFGEDILSSWLNRKNHANKIAEIRDNYLYNAPPEEARVYYSAKSALSSIGKLKHTKGKKGFTYTLPDYLEIHEIKESFVCVMRPDGSSNCDEEKEK